MGMNAKPDRILKLQHLRSYMLNRPDTAYPHDDYMAGYDDGHKEGYAQGVGRMLDILEAPDINGSIVEGAVL